MNRRASTGATGTGRTQGRALVLATCQICLQLPLCACSAEELKGQPLLVQAAVHSTGSRRLLMLSDRDQAEPVVLDPSATAALVADVWARRVAYRTAAEPATLLLRELGDHEPARFALTGGVAEIVEIRWSPSGDQVALAARRESGELAAFVLSTTEGPLVELGALGAGHQRLLWSPDSRYLTSDQSVELRAFDVGAPGAHASFGGAAAVTWSPQSDRIYYASLDVGQHIVAAADGAQPVSLHPLAPAPDLRAVWSPGGEWIAFANGSGATAELVISAPNGTYSAVAASLADPCFRWSPDGRRVAYLVYASGGRRALYLWDLWLGSVGAVEAADIDVPPHAYAWSHDGTLAYLRRGSLPDSHALVIRDLAAEPPGLHFLGSADLDLAGPFSSADACAPPFAWSSPSVAKIAHPTPIEDGAALQVSDVDGASTFTLGLGTPSPALDGGGRFLGATWAHQSPSLLYIVDDGLGAHNLMAFNDGELSLLFGGQDGATVFEGVVY